MKAKNVIAGYWKSHNKYKGTTYEDDYRKLSKADECLVWYVYKLKKEIRKLSRKNRQLQLELAKKRVGLYDTLMGKIIKDNIRNGGKIIDESISDFKRSTWKW